MEKITVRELLTRDIDIDVVDDFDETIYIAFVGPMELTTAGRDKFRRVLDLEIEIDDSGCNEVAIIQVYDLSNRTQSQLDALTFFWSAAGYCADDDYHRWFLVDED